MQYKKCDRVRYPKKPDWGIAKCSPTVLTERYGFLHHAGEKTISLNFVQPEKLSGDAASSPFLDQLDLTAQPTKDAKGKAPCTNCGAPTQFGDIANPMRYRLGGVSPVSSTASNV
ncbi:hypothetical protein SAMN05216404_10914 [Nitrosospira multiformis]|uniref:Uncharacterized protein n=1 Tax=Nitrosospira multiformis TaxID=1231 RepID=A0A1H8KQP5_9PROT|nr:hypothetical protein [Nitrosospira multiformis]SEN95230.1 hypothetical protein SAMN05216404_10914 [Nitrosospira multiformis]